jgi:hypothetical protein
MFPLELFECTLTAMNRRLSDHLIRATCRELLKGNGQVTGRRLRRELRERFGYAGRTARVFGIWREETAARSCPPVANAPQDTADLQRRLAAAEAQAAENLARAERAEIREMAHQDHWALKIDRLREQLRDQPALAAQVRALETQVLKLTAELHATRS